MPKLFVGIFLPDDIKPDIMDFQSSLENLPMKMKPMSKKNLHITLAFPFYIPHYQIPEYSERLKELCSRHKKFSVKVSKGFLIPNEEHIRVIALEAKSSGNQLEYLRKGVMEAVGGESHPPHLTIGRVRTISDRRMVSEVVKKCSVEKFFEVESIKLVKSSIGGAGMKYKVLEDFKLC